MRTARVPVLAVLLAASVGVLPAAPPPIPRIEKDWVRTGVKDGDTIDVPAGRYADLTIDIPAGATVVTRIEGAVAQKSDGLPAGRMIFAGTGVIRVNNTLIDFKAQTATQLDFTVRFGPPAPPPVPPDPPKPDPGPAPDGQVSTFVVVEDTTKAGPWRGEILGSPDVEKFYRQLRGTRTGVIHTLLDVNDPDAVPELKKYVTAAAGKGLPYLFLLDAGGKVVKEGTAPTKSPADFIAFFDAHHDAPRAMGLIMAAPRLKWVEFGSTPNTPIIPRTQWPKSRRLTTFLPPVYDQDGIGQCASSSCCTVIETAAYLRGIPYPKLSAGDLYSRVNGGRDNGSLLEDNIAEAMKNGVAPASMVPYVWDRRRHNTPEVVAARKKYRVAEAYWCPSFDAMVSAILQGYAVGHGLMWFNNFKPDADGWLPARGFGRAGGHALCGYGIETKADGTVGIVTRNSWSASWGVAGDCIIPESLFSGQIGGYYAVRVVTSPTAAARRIDPFARPEFALAP